MNTSKSLVASLALALGFATPALATNPQALSSMLATQVLGQANRSKAAGDRQQADSLLSEARKALKQGNLEEAEAMVSKLEGMKLEYSVFHLGDTPKKLRADLTAAKRAKKQPQRPSQKHSPEVPNSTSLPLAESQAAVPPAAAKVPSEVRNPADEAPLALPQSDGKLTQSAPSQRVSATPEEELGTTLVTPQPKRENPLPEQDNPVLKRQSDTHLLAARRALAVGDVRRATAAVEEARKLGVNYPPQHDSPDKVEAAIRKYSLVVEATAGRNDEAARHQLADSLMDQAQQLVRWRDYDEAERLAYHVQNMRVNFGPYETKPEVVLEKIATARGEKAGASAAAAKSPVTNAGAAKDNSGFAGAQALYDGQRDGTRNRVTSAQEDAPLDPLPQEAASGEPPLERLPTSADGQPLPENLSEGMQLFRQGEQALRERDVPKALDYFKRAYALRDTIDPATAQRLQDHLQLLSAPAQTPRAGGESLLDATASKQQLLARQVSADLAKREIAAGKIQESNPMRAMEILKEARVAVEGAGIEQRERAILLRRVDSKVAELEKYITANKAKIELDEANREVMKEVDARLNGKVEVDEKLAKLVDEFNRMMDEQRWAEAEVLAKRAREMDPDNPVVKQLIWQSRFVQRTQRNKNRFEDKEKGYWTAMSNVEDASVPFDDNEPIQMPDARKWSELTDRRSKQLAARSSRRTERELEIERKLKTPVSLKFRERPLSEVLDQLAKLAAVNLHLDPKGLDEEGVSSDTPITIDLTQDISLKSALNLILEPLHLSYVIKDEVLKITSEQLRDGVIYPEIYNVADLVIPIPNFVPNPRAGLAGALSDAYQMTGAGIGGGPGTGYLASHDGSQATGIVNPAVLAQINQLMPAGSGGRMASGVNQPVNLGPGGMGGGAQADFDTLIELITTTVKPQTWDEVGGPGSISPFPNNLSLVISQTQDVHEEIVDLLDQLRRNQDLQVTIEVRFITLNDNFFERIGVDFQFNITTEPTQDPRSLTPTNKKEIVGLNPPAAGAPFPNYTTDFSIPFRQNSFNLATPQFGAPVEVANFGFAILSDLEAFLLVSAAQGDRRSNVLQAPKVTLFNGQQASVFDQTSTPFVISVIPVVGDFAAAYQPVITVLSEGTSLTVQATISNDRRFVRLTVLPFFSQIGDVREFTFSGSKTTTKKTTSEENTGGGGDSTSNSDDTTTSTDGVTIQLPNFSFVTVNTTVSVPDGGTVLLGGIKRLSEGRNEFGVPILSKLPYINRLFKNVGIGRETQSLMMMVTPRIIIQEEEEERLGIVTPP